MTILVVVSVYSIEAFFVRICKPNETIVTAMVMLIMLRVKNRSRVKRLLLRVVLIRQEEED